MEDPPQPLSIKARIAAMKLEQVGRTPATPPPTYQQSQAAANAVSQSRAAPLLTPPRPNLEHRSHTVTGEVDKTIGNQPADKESIGLLHSTFVERRSNMLVNDMAVLESSPPLPPRRPSEQRVKPQLPPRNPSQQAPCLPARRPSELSTVSRRDSAGSTSSGISTVSLIPAQAGATIMSTTSISGDACCKRAPAYDLLKPSALPMRMSKEDNDSARQERRTSQPTHSKPTIVAERPAPVAEIPPSLPARREMAKRDIPSTKPRPSALSFAMNKSTKIPPPLPLNKPRSVPAPAADVLNSFSDKDHDVVELDSSNFDNAILHSGKAALVSFSAPFCHACKNLDPSYAALARSFASAKDRLVIAKVNAYEDKALSQRYDIQAWPTLKWFDGSGGPPVEPGYLVHGGDLESLQNYITQQTGIQPNASHQAAISLSSPPVPLSTRPNLAHLLSSKPRPSNHTVVSTPSSVNTQSTPFCLKCRDFSLADTHASRFPLHTLPSTDIAWLAHQLTDPFASLTDKARAIFTWLHHNIAYDVDAFFTKTVQPATPSSTLTSGLAVCAGYAGLFAALASKVGMEAIVINGHGKGYGHTALTPGAPIPAFASNHAWNAVKMDDGDWKLIDACWGAGNVRGPDKPYDKCFKPQWFTMSNVEFGANHYPSDRRQFYGRDSVSWEEYYVGDLEVARLGGCVTVFGAAVGEHGLCETSFVPRGKRVVLDEQNGTVRFRFEKMCAHWDPLVHGKGLPYLFILSVEGRGEVGRKEYKAFTSDGECWYCDVSVQELEASRGGEVQCCAVTTWNGRDGRGLSAREFDEGRAPGRGWSVGFGGVASWEVV